jgi:antitoxin YefM
LTVLELRGVSKTYGEGPTEVHALCDVDLSVDAGSLVAVMGPSGSGKSTLLTMAGTLEPRDDRFRVVRHRLRTTRRHRRPRHDAAPDCGPTPVLPRQDRRQGEVRRENDVAKHVDLRLGFLAILLAMAASDHVSLADVKNRLSEVVERLERDHGRVIITKHGRPAAVMLSVEDLESLEETLAILSDPSLMRDIQRSAREARAGTTVRLNRDEALGRVKRS